MKFRAVSTLIASIILIVITISVGATVYWIAFSWMNPLSPSLDIQVASTELIVVGDRAMLSISVKNTGSKPLIGIIVVGYDGGGKCFKLALPPAAPRQTSGNTLIIPLGVSNIVLDGSGNNNHGIIYGAIWVDGKYGKALYFNGNNWVIIQPLYNLPNTNEITAMFWIKPLNPEGTISWRDYFNIWRDGSNRITLEPAMGWGVFALLHE